MSNTVNTRLNEIEYIRFIKDFSSEFPTIKIDLRDVFVEKAEGLNTTPVVFENEAKKGVFYFGINSDYDYDKEDGSLIEYEELLYLNCETEKNKRGNEFEGYPISVSEIESEKFEADFIQLFRRSNHNVQDVFIEKAERMDMTSYVYSTENKTVTFYFSSSLVYRPHGDESICCMTMTYKDYVIETGG